MLSQEALLERIKLQDSRRIIIDPFNEESLKDGCYTFHLSPFLSMMRGDPIQRDAVIDLRSSDGALWSQRSMLRASGPPAAPGGFVNYRDVGYRFVPGEFVLCTTMEELVLPPDIACLLSTYPRAARVGIDFLQTSTLIPPGSRCQITLETKNNGLCSVHLYSGMKAVKGIFLRVA